MRGALCATQHGRRDEGEAGGRVAAATECVHGSRIVTQLRRVTQRIAPEVYSGATSASSAGRREEFTLRRSPCDERRPSAARRPRANPQGQVMFDAKRTKLYLSVWRRRPANVRVVRLRNAQDEARANAPVVYREPGNNPEFAGHG